MPVPRCGFSRAREIGTESSNGSLAILFMATSVLCWPRRTVFQQLRTLGLFHTRNNVTIIGSEARVLVSVGRRSTAATFVGQSMRERVALPRGHGLPSCFSLS
jgi:hypothetical protein